MADNIYFADKDAEDTAEILLNRANHWMNEIEVNGYLDKLREMWAAYHGAYYSSSDDSHSIHFGGEQGELTFIAVNHLRNLAQNILVMVTSSRPSAEARSTNTDYKSLVQTKLANGLLDYYFREKRLEKYFKTAVEYAIVLGSGFVKMEWNGMTGEIYDYIEPEINPETGEPDGEGFPIHEGDIEFKNLSPFDVVFDDFLETHDEAIWVLTRSFKNKYDIAAKYPELEEKILNLQSKSDVHHFSMSTYTFNETEQIPVYEFYHKKTESIPDGRYLMFLDSDVVLNDTPMPYRELPVYRISASDILGTPYGYSPLFDILPIQDAVNSLYSSILTNQSNFAVQNLWVPRGSDISISALEGGMNIIEGNEQFGKPEAINFTSTPKEVFDFLQILERAQETISGVNSVSRGNPESSLKSGTALALVQSMSLQYMSGLQASYVQLMEDVGTGIISMLRDFASVPRIAAISGKDNRTYMKEFTGDDLSTVNRVIIDVGNPLSRTTAGRVEMAEQLLQMGLLKTPEHYFSVMNTGRLDVMTDDAQSELLLIKAENEKLVSREPVIMMVTDQHTLHIKEHRRVLADPDLRFDEELGMAVTAHMQEHIEALRTTDPDLLNIIQEQPLGPPGGSPADQPGADQMAPPDESMQGQAPDAMANPQMQGQAPAIGAEGMPNLPNIPNPPAPFENLPVTAEDSMIGSE